MGRIDRTARLRWALAIGVVCNLTGCQQFRSPAPNSSLSWGSQPSPGSSPALSRDPKGAAKITAVQEADVQIALGRSAERRGDLAQAMAAYQEALSRDRRRADAYLRLAILFDQQGKSQESEPLYRKALALQPGDPDIYCDMGYSLYLQRRWSEAEMNLRQAIALQPNRSRAHNNLALVLAHTNRTEEAWAEFRKGGNTPAEAHANLAFALTLDRRWELARSHYQRALAADPSSAVARARLQELNSLVARLDPGPRATTRDARVIPAAAPATPANR